MNIKTVIVFFIFNINSIATMDKTVDQEVEAFKKKLAAAHVKKNNQRKKLDPIVAMTIIIWARQQLSQYNKRKVVIEISTIAPLLKELEKLYNKIVPYKNRNNLSQKIKSDLQYTLKWFNTPFNIFRKIPKNAFLTPKTLKKIKNVIESAEIGVAQILDDIREYNAAKFRIIQRHNSQLRQKASRSKIKHQMRKCSCCKKNIAIQ